MSKARADRRVSLHRRVSRDTMRLLRSLSKQLKLSQGETIDRAVQALAVAESFGAEHLRLRNVCPHNPSCEPNCETLTVPEPYRSESLGGEHLRLKRHLDPTPVMIVHDIEGVKRLRHEPATTLDATGTDRDSKRKADKPYLVPDGLSADKARRIGYSRSGGGE